MSSLSLRGQDKAKKVDFFVMVDAKPEKINGSFGLIPLEDVQIHLTLSNGQHLSSVTTDQGTTLFKGVPAGCEYVAEISPAGYIHAIYHGRVPDKIGFPTEFFTAKFSSESEKEPSFFDEAVRSLSASQGNLSSRMLTDLIEVKQYLLANMFWNKLGVNSNYNMKRESLNSAESQLNDDALLPYPNIIVKTIQEDLDKLNEAVGTNIKVRLGSVWGDRRELQDAQVEIMTEGGDPDGSAGETETSEPEQVPEEQPV